MRCLASSLRVLLAGNMLVAGTYSLAIGSKKLLYTSALLTTSLVRELLVAREQFALNKNCSQALFSQ